MYGELSERDIDALLGRHRYGRVAFELGGQLYITPINYAWADGVLYGQAPEGTKVRGMREHPIVAFEVDEIEDPAHWRSVLLHGRFLELHEREAKQAAFARILAQAGGGERSEVSWAMDMDHLVVFKIDVSQRSGRFEQRQAVAMRPARVGPLPPVPQGNA